MNKFETGYLNYKHIETALEDRMEMQCEYNAYCNWNCKECLLDHEDITPERRKEFLKWEKENEKN